jgi:hypothetical protein
MLAADGKSWDPALFTPQPTFSRFELLNRAIGGSSSIGALALMQGCLRRMNPAWHRKERTYVAAHIRFMENSLRLRGAKIYLDCTKLVRRARLFAACPGVRMKVVQLVRDGRAFCCSYLKNRKLPRTKLPEASRAWLKSIKAVDRFHASFPDVSLLGVRYEDLCQDLPGTLKSVCEFLDVRYEPALESNEVPRCHILGNRMRLTFSGKVEEFLTWQRELTADEIAFLNSALKKGLDRFHYSTSSNQIQSSPA